MVTPIELMVGLMHMQKIFLSVSKLGNIMRNISICIRQYDGQIRFLFCHCEPVRFCLSKKADDKKFKSSKFAAKPDIEEGKAS